jgi:DNA polymerase-4
VVEKASIDEAYMDFSGTRRLLGPTSDVCATIKAEIAARFSLTCSIGIAPNKFLAKIASDWKKPDGLFVIPEEEVARFLEDLPVSKIPGVGSRTLELLKRYRVETAGDIRRFSAEFWEERLGQRGLDLWARAHGRHDAPVTASRTPKSCGSENTFARDITDVSELQAWILHQSEEVGFHLRRIGFRGKTVTLKVKFNDFTIMTRRTTLTRPTQTTKTIYETAAQLLSQIRISRGVRLTGVSVSHFSTGPEQLALFRDVEQARQNELDQAMDRIKLRFGKNSIQRGRRS